MENLENQPFNGNDQGEEDFLSLAEIWALIWNHKKWYAVSVVIGVFFAAFYIYRTSPTFSRILEAGMPRSARIFSRTGLTSVAASSTPEA